ncbi:MAG: right-handed parallel beta-helix repeat-containing protein [Fibrobacteria bacterium]|nr:right-handed parallel beta-helix repeat-containing protein [Fibrobacteria bacterium]
MRPVSTLACLGSFLLVVACGSDSPARQESELRSTILPDTSSVEFVEPTVAGRTFWVDPVHGTPSGDGSAEHPWRTLQEVLDSGLVAYYAPTNSDPGAPMILHDSGAPVQGGDRLYLKSGYHGFVRRNRFCFQDWLHIEAAPNDTPVLAQFQIVGAFQKIHLKGLRFRKEDWIPSDTATGDQKLWWKAQAINRNSGAMVQLQSNTFYGSGREVVLQGLDVRSARDVSGWLAQDWVDRATTGIALRSVRSARIQGCHVENISFGVSIDYGSDSTIAMDNHVKRFSGDGFRLISDHCRLERNRIEGCMKVDGNHDDGIQTWSRGSDGSSGTGVVVGNILRDNLIVGIIDSTDPLRGSPQGIGAFDGMFDGWVVERNVVVSNTYHGISFYGIRNSRVANNTVIDQLPDDDVSPWILVRAHKDGRAARNVVVTGNLAMASVGANGESMTDSGNAVIGKRAFHRLAWLFEDAFHGNVRLRKNDSTSAFFRDAPVPGAYPASP